MTPNIAIEGDNIILTCDASPGPGISASEIQFAFYKDGELIKAFCPAKQHTVQSAQLVHSGNYSCEVRWSTKSLGKKTQEMLYIQIQELFSRPVIKITPQWVTSESEMRLTCKTSLITSRKSTQLQYAFYKGEEIIQEFNKSNQYIVPSIQLEDSGNYSCEVRASNNGIRKRSTEVPINVAIEGGTYTYLLIVVSMVVVVLLLLLIAATLYKCRQRRSPVFLSQEPMTGDEDSDDPEKTSDKKGTAADCRRHSLD
ncbi:Fc receptor-like protein 5 isoform X2 [Hyperolius riggenbachi]|uniref:Fc receptor-like protein 5 isoform X2 n=1 Tax=Hyperolius riggenbachi TaxID=752182 RepID=UPI0035A2A433